MSLRYRRVLLRKFHTKDSMRNPMSWVFVAGVSHGAYSHLVGKLPDMRGSLVVFRNFYVWIMRIVDFIRHI
jgi:hypothetical protein